MLESLLIANRGEIAARIIRTATRLGIRTIAVYSSADVGAPFVALADSAVFIGAAPARESYLDPARILGAARTAGAAAVHPGYGFLSENAAFADAVMDAGLIWVGAPAGAIRAMGLKDAAKTLMMAAGVPVTPGYLGEEQSPARLAAEAAAIGYPVLIKAVAGGGGKGMRRVTESGEFADSLASCRREAAAAFGDDRVLIEKYITAPRHLEVQVFGDRHGNVVHLFERDCSLQRRHQKVIEEAPAPGMDWSTREFLCDAAVRAARAVDYVGAGTVEFIADASQGLRADRIWFMEMNTRLQVEHPVTEAITGQDLVEWQLRVASGEPLPLQQTQIAMDGWAIEARLYAENPSNGFLPSTGPLRHLRLPSTVRVDSGVEEGGEVTGYYDPLLAKLIAHAPSRAAAARRLSAACAAVEVWPVRTNAAFLARVSAAPAFLAGRIDTAFIETHAADLLPPHEPAAPVVAAAAAALRRAAGMPSVDESAPSGPWVNLCGFRVNAPPYERVDVAVGDREYSVSLAVPATEEPPHPECESRAQSRLIGGERVLFWRGEAWRFGSPSRLRAATAAGASDGALRSPMPGRVVSISVRAGEAVKRGQALVSIEAMKMEHGLTAPFDGVVAEIAVELGDQVAENIVLVRITQPQR